MTNFGAFFVRSQAYKNLPNLVKHCKCITVGQNSLMVMDYGAPFPTTKLQPLQLTDLNRNRRCKSSYWMTQFFSKISEILIFNEEKQLFHGLHRVAFAAYFGLP